MSDLGRYRRSYVRLWRHPGFVALSDAEKVLMLYLLTGMQTNRIGLYVLSIATAAEDLGSVPQTIKKRLVNVCVAFGWKFDAAARVFYIPSWWRWNPPENANVLKGNLKDLNEIPPCSLLDAFAANMQTLSESLHHTFLEGLRQRLPQGSPNQEQYQDQKQKQEQSRALCAAQIEDGNDTKQDEPTLREIDLARETLQMSNLNASIDDLADDYLCRCRFNGLNGTKARALVVLTLARSERR